MTVSYLGSDIFKSGSINKVLTTSLFTRTQKVINLHINNNNMTITLNTTPATLARIAETVESHKWSLMQFVETCGKLPSMPGEEEEDARIMSKNKQEIVELRQLEFAIAEILETAEINANKVENITALL